MALYIPHSNFAFGAAFVCQAGKLLDPTTYVVDEGDTKFNKSDCMYHVYSFVTRCSSEGVVNTLPSTRLVDRLLQAIAASYFLAIQCVYCVLTAFV